MSWNYTPGPWETATERPAGLGVDWIWVGPRDWHKRICRIVAYTGQEDEHLANAHLIAAAPELLEALEGAIGALEQDVDAGVECDDDDWIGIAKQRLEAARAAIAKARGQ